MLRVIVGYDTVSRQADGEALYVGHDGIKAKAAAAEGWRSKKYVRVTEALVRHELRCRRPDDVLASAKEDVESEDVEKESAEKQI